MTRVNFGYNLKKDTWSWVVIAKSRDLWGLDYKKETAYIPKDLLKEIKRSTFAVAQRKVENYLKNNHDKKKEKIIKNKIESLKKLWQKREKKYFNVLSKVTEKTIYRNNFGCFYTSGFMCPYNEKEGWFMVSMWHDISYSITTICHEIMHLQFLHHYKKYLQKSGLNNNQIEDLKESLTFLLNGKEFKGIILSGDRGYPKHQKLRKKLKKIWATEVNFKYFLDKAVKVIKK